MSDTLKRIKMLNGWVFAEAISDRDNCGKIIIPDMAEEVTQKGRIVALGKSIARGDKNIKLHDLILFRQNAGFREIELDGRKYLVMKRNQILGVLFGKERAFDVAPLNKNIFLEWEQAQSVYEGTNLIRPEMCREMHYTGTIRAVGPDAKAVKPGERVFFDRFCGVEKFQEEGKRFAFIHEEDVYCKGLPQRKEVAA